MQFLRHIVFALAVATASVPACAQQPATFAGYLALGTATGSWSELATGGYLRQPITLGAMLNGQASSIGGTTFGPATTSWGMVTERAIYDAQNGGNLIGWWQLHDQVAVASGATLTTGAISIYFDAVARSATAGATPFLQWIAGATIGHIGNGPSGSPITAGAAVNLLAGVLSVGPTPAAIGAVATGSANASGGFPQLGAAAQIAGDNLPRWIGASTRVQFGGFGANYAPLVGRAGSGVTSRILEATPSSGPGTYALRFKLSGMLSGTETVPGVTNGAGEQAAPNDVTYQMSIETNLPGVTSWANGDSNIILSKPVTLGGNPAMLVKAGAPAVWTDPIYITMPAGTHYYLRVYASEPTANAIPVRLISHAANFEGSNNGQSTGLTFATGNGSATTFSATVASTYLPVVSLSTVFQVPGFSNVTVSVANGGGAGIDTCPTNANGVASCSLNLSTGALSITTLAAVANAATINGSLTGGTPGGNQTQTTALNPFNYATNNIANNPLVGPVAVEALQLPTGPRMRGLCAIGDSIDQGIGDVASGNVLLTDTSWIDFSAGGRFGIVKTAVSGEQLGIWASANGHYGRSLMMSGSCDRGIDNEGTNELPNGKSLSQLINYQLSALPGLTGLFPHGAADLWWVTMLPRQPTSGTGFFAIGSGPYAAAGAGYGAGAVVNPTPLGSAYGTRVIGNGIQGCTITGNGTTGPYSCAFSGATMPGSLWSDGAATTVVDTGTAGTNATTLTGSLVATGTHTPSTGAVSLTLSSALAAGSTVNLYAFLSGPSARNAWNYYLFNWAVPRGLVAGVIDTASCVEQSPASAMGAGTGLWGSASWTYDYTHPSNQGHAAVIPGCIGPTGTNPSPVFSFPN